MSIINETSKSYFASKFSSTMLMLEDGTPAVIPSDAIAGISAPIFTTDGRVRVLALKGSPEKPVKEEVFLDYDYFDSMEKFTVPDLGWRMAAGGRVMVYLSRASRSYKKGVALEALSHSWAGHTLELFDTGNLSRDYYSRGSVLAMLVMQPSFMPLPEALAALNSDKIMACAISDKLALLPTSGDSYEIAYGSHIVGTMNPDGSAQMQIPHPFEALL